MKEVVALAVQDIASKDPGDSYSTQPTLLGRVKNPDDEKSWQEFDRIYGELIRGFAM